MDGKSKCAYINKHGSVENIQVDFLPLKPLNGLIEVEIKYAGMNFADNYMREGLNTSNFPFILGIEAVGVITAIENDAQTNLKVGQRVICYDISGGLYSQIVRIDPKKCFELPNDISYKVGAAIFVNYLTAYFALFEIGNLKPYEDVFVKSCAGGVGSAVTQLAKLKEGVQIFGTASPGKEKYALNNGVNFVFSYENFEKEYENNCPNGFDIVIENESGNSFNSMCQKLKPLGRIISIGANDLIGNDERLTYFKILKFFTWNVKNIDRQAMVMNSQSIAGLHLGNLCSQMPEKVYNALQLLFELVREEKISPKIDSIWSLEDIKDATKLLVNRKNMGKVLIKFE